jgi:CheY-like chemotaxis protein
MPRILLIEDEVVLRSMMARGLGRTPGYEVLDAGTLEDGVRLLDGHGIDLVVSDIDLPGRSGIELLAELSARGLRVPVVFVSGYLGHYAAQIPHHEDLEVLEKSGRGALARRTLRPSAPLSDEVSWAGLEVPTPPPPPTKPSSHLDVPPSRARPEPPHASAREREPEPSRRLHEPRVASSREPPPRDDGFELAWDEGVGALLRKDYHAALEAFLRARAIRPDDTKVTVNLRRLAELGVSEAS